MSAPEYELEVIFEGTSKYTVDEMCFPGSISSGQMTFSFPTNNPPKHDWVLTEGDWYCRRCRRIERMKVKV